MDVDVPKFSLKDGLLSVDLPLYESQQLADAMKGRIRQASHWEDVPRAMQAVSMLARMVYTLSTQSRFESLSREDVRELQSMWWPPNTRHVETAMNAVISGSQLRTSKGSADPAWQAGIANDFEAVFG